MSVKLVAITKPLVEGLETADEFIAYCARVSNPSNQMNSETSSKLIRYLIKHKHWSPFEQVSCTMEIETTRDIGRQILRHRSFAFQEFSQRYADPTKGLGFITRECRLQDPKNRQNSIEVDDKQLAEDWILHQKGIINACQKTYEWAIKAGIAKEQARVILPEGLTVSRMYMTGSLRSWIHYVDVRAPEGTQKEHRLIAEQVKEQLIEYFPSLYEYFYAKEEPEKVEEGIGKHFLNTIRYYLSLGG